MPAVGSQIRIERVPELEHPHNAIVALAHIHKLLGRNHIVRGIGKVFHALGNFSQTQIYKEIA